MSPSIPQLPLLSQIPNTNTSRNRASSLSIARSPAVLASTSITQHDIPITRIRSGQHQHHTRTKSTLEDISDNLDILTDEEDFPRQSLQQHQHQHQHERLSSEAGHLLRDEESESDDYEVRGRDEGGGKGYDYHGPFQPPSTGELLGVVLSFGGVILLSVAAGLTTIYDWVL